MRRAHFCELQTHDSYWCVRCLIKGQLAPFLQRSLLSLCIPSCLLPWAQPPTFMPGNLKFWPCSWKYPGMQQSPVLNTPFLTSSNSTFSDWASSPGCQQSKRIFLQGRKAISFHASVFPTAVLPSSPLCISAQTALPSPCVSALRLDCRTRNG